MIGQEKKFVVGLTGTYGSGKSTVGKLFRELGACVINSDKLAGEVFERPGAARNRIKKLFGMSGRLEKSHVAAVIFSDKKKRRALEKIIHPYVFRRIREEAARAAQRIVVLEVPLLFETGADKQCCATVAVVSDLKTIVRRLGKKGLLKKEIMKRINAQFLQREKKSRADFIIYNTSSIRQLRKQTQTVWRAIKECAND